MPVNREPHSIDDHAEEESAVRRAPYEQDDAYELQDHEFTLVAEAEEAAESNGWPYDEHTTPWTTVGVVPPLPAWAAKSRALLEPPTLPRPLNDETPTVVEESADAISATAVRALREELAESVRDATAQRARIDQLESALAAAGRAADRATFEDDRASSGLLGQVQGQAARIEELDAAVRALVTRREELEDALKAAEAQAGDAATKIEGLELALKASDLQLREAAAKVEELEARAAVTVEWIENAAPSLEVTIEVDANDEPPLAAAETTLEIDPETDLVDAESELPELRTPPAEPVAPDEIPTRVLRRPPARDDFQRIDGIGKRLAARLEEAGIRTFAQLAALEKKDLARVTKQVGVSPERIAREGWLKQARKLKSKPAKHEVRSQGRASASATKRKASQARSRKRA